MSSFVDNFCQELKDAENRHGTCRDICNTAIKRCLNTLRIRSFLPYCIRKFTIFYRYLTSERCKPLIVHALKDYMENVTLTDNFFKNLYKCGIVLLFFGNMVTFAYLLYPEYVTVKASRLWNVINKTVAIVAGIASPEECTSHSASIKITDVTDECDFGFKYKVKHNKTLIPRLSSDHSTSQYNIATKSDHQFYNIILSNELKINDLTYRFLIPPVIITRYRKQVHDLLSEANARMASGRRLSNRSKNKNTTHLPRSRIPNEWKKSAIPIGEPTSQSINQKETCRTTVLGNQESTSSPIPKSHNTKRSPSSSPSRLDNNNLSPKRPVMCAASDGEKESIPEYPSRRIPFLKRVSGYRVIKAFPRQNSSCI